MAELNEPATGGHRNIAGVQRSKKRSTRVDLTPMVDLGFLLITFFVFTTSLSKPKSMKLLLPRDSRDPMLLKESAVLTLFPSGNDRLFFYEGMDPSKLQSARFQSLREIIRSKQFRTNPAEFMIIIKPTSTCSYKNTISVFDEMIIDQVKSYALVDISKEEMQFLASKEN
jgi:biopolymer transport protein ExbD